MAEDAGSCGLIEMDAINGRESPSTDGNVVNTQQESPVSLRQKLRFHRYAPIKMKDGKCHIHVVYCVIMFIQCIKIGLISWQTMAFASDRVSFSSEVNRGHLVLRHILLKSWDSGMETPHYPPAHGDFAMYHLKGLLEELNYAIEAYYNMESDVIGFYELYNNGDRNDDMVIKMKYYELPASGNIRNDPQLLIRDSEIRVGKETFLVSTVDPKTNRTTYTYNITKAFDVMNVTERLQRLLSINLDFSFHSMRVKQASNSALCLYIGGTVSFRDEENNGQMIEDLVTSSTRKRCSDINIYVKDVDLITRHKGLEPTIIVLCIFTIAFTFLFSMNFGLKVYKDIKDTTLPIKKEYRKLSTFLIWDFLMLLSDSLIIAGTVKVHFSSTADDVNLSKFDSPAILLSIGALLSFLYILKIFKMHHNFFILIKILRATFFPMLAYSVFVVVLFGGFFLFGYAVLGPYHVKFASASATFETLYSIFFADEIFSTIANVDDQKTGTKHIWWISRVYVGAYVAVFSLVVFNILVAIFVGAHDTIKNERQKLDETPEFGSLEKALNDLLTKKSNEERLNLQSSLFDAIGDEGNDTPEISQVKAEFEKVWKTIGCKESDNISKPEEQTLKEFMVGNQDQENSEGCRLIIYVFPARTCFLLKKKKLVSSN